MNSRCMITVVVAAVALTLNGADPLRNPALANVAVGAAPLHDPIAIVVDGVAQFQFAATGGVRTVKARDALTEAFEKAGVRFMPGHGRFTFRLHDNGSATNEAFTVKTDADGVTISGQTLWGADDFIERFLGARFYHAGVDGELHPEVRNLTLKPMSYSDSPRMRNRGGWPVEGEVLGSLKEMSHTLGVEITRNDWLKWRERNRAFNASDFIIMHEPEPTKWSRYYADKVTNLIERSFFRRADGRLFHNFNDHMGNSYDVTSFDFVECLIETYRHYYSLPKAERNSLTGFRYLTDEYIVFGQTDTQPQLHEMQAVEVVKREGLITEKNIALGEPGWFSDVYARFYRRLAERIKEEFPGKKLIVMPYQTYTYPPTQERFYPLPDNIEAGVCLGHMPRFVKNKAALEDAKRHLGGWRRALGGRPVQETWAYASANNAFVQACAFNYTGEFIREMGPLLGDIGIFHEQGPMSSKFPGHSTHALFHWELYVMERQVWDESFNVNAALDEYFDLMYGAAAADLKRFYGILTAAYEKFAVANRNPNQLYPQKTLNDMERCLDDADRAAASCTERERARIKRFEMPFRREIKSHRARHAFTTPQTLANRTTAQIVIDGRDDEDDWGNAHLADVCRSDGSGEAPQFAPTVRLLWNDGGIYGCVVQTNDARMSEASLWKNDTVEFIVAPGLGKERYYQVAFDAKGRIFTQRRVLKPIPQQSDLNWKAPGMKFMTRECGKGWAVEFFIPFAAYENPPPRPYDSWNYLVTYTKLSEPQEMVSTSSTLGNNLVPDRYGVMKFLGRKTLASAAPPYADTRKYRGYRENDHVYEASVLLKNDVGFYGMELMTYKPDRNGETDTFFFLSSPRYYGGFGSSSCRFLRMNVNGIALDRLYPAPDALRRSKAGNPVWKLNFDGAGVDVEASRKPGDQLLYLTFSRAQESVTQVTNALVSLECFISAYDRQERYDRFCRTARRHLGMHKGRHTAHRIVETDRFLFLADHVLDGTAEDRGNGPSYVKLPEDWSGIERCELDMQKTYWCGVRFHLKKDFAPFTVGILQTQNRTSNAECEKLLGIEQMQRH